MLGSYEFAKQQVGTVAENEMPKSQSEIKARPELPDKQSSARSKHCTLYPQAIKPTLFEVDTLSSEPTATKITKKHFLSAKHHNLDLK